MKAGALRWPITIQQRVPSQSSTTGEVTYTWTTFASVWADMAPVAKRGSRAAWEAVIAEQVKAQRVIQFVIRYIPGVNEQMRIRRSVRAVLGHQVDHQQRHAQSRVVADRGIRAQQRMRTIVVLGCGPSLTQADVDYCRGKAEVMAVNDAWRLAPWADWMYAADVSWWGMHAGAVKSRVRRRVLDAERAGGRMVRPAAHLQRRRAGLEPRPAGDQPERQQRRAGDEPRRITWARSGSCCSGSTCAARTFHGSHPAPLNDPIALSFQVWQQGFHALAEGLAWQGIKVVNCSRHTKLTGFTRGALETTL
jgi:head-tail adaptor